MGLLGFWTSSIMYFPKNEHNEGENSFGSTAHRQSSGNREFAISVLRPVLGTCVLHDNVVVILLAEMNFRLNFISCCSNRFNILLPDFNFLRVFNFYISFLSVHSL